MHAWLTAETLVAGLLVTSFTCVGLLAIWAAVSPRHWFLRTAVVMAALMPLLVVPMYEPLVAFTIQCAVVTGGLTLSGWASSRWLNRNSPAKIASRTSRPGMRYSLSTLLLAMFVVAVATPIVIKLPRLNFIAWRSAVLVAIIAGLTTLVALWMTTSKRKLLAWPIGLLLVFWAALFLCATDWFAYSLVKQGVWPPAGQILTTDLFGGAVHEPLQKVWLLVLPTTLLLLVLISLIWLAPLPFVSRVLSRSALAVLVILIAAFPLTVYWMLLHPISVPAYTMPTPNGIDDIEAASKAFNTSQILMTNVEPQSTTELAAEIAKYDAAFKQLRLGLSREICLQDWQHDLGTLDRSLDGAQMMRLAARGLMRDAELAQQQKRYKDAANISLESTYLGQSMMHNGVLVDYLVGIAIEGMGDYTLYHSLAGLNAAESREIAAKLARTELTREPVASVVLRDRIWAEHTNGWWGHLEVILNDIVPQSDPTAMANGVLERTLTEKRLMLAELAVRAYRQEHGSLPVTLQSLVPDYLAEVPTDPLDPAKGKLHYVVNTDKFTLYSVGFDGRDNGGAIPPEESRSMWDESVHADLRLDDFYVPDEPQVGQPPPSGDNEAEK